jgi:hypothetical protein
MPTDTIARTTDRRVNGVRVVASVLGVCAGLSGLDHGLFEALQGNAGTPGLFVEAIGPAQRMWVHGTEDAFTLVPNFLVTGILAMVLGLLTIVWSIGFIDRTRGSTVFLLLGVLMFLVGGGVGMLAFLLFGWAVARRIRRPITWWQSVVPQGASRALSRAWPWLAAAGLALCAFALEIAIAGLVPVVSDPDQIRVISWSALGAAFVVLMLALVGASAGAIGRVAAERSA